MSIMCLFVYPSGTVSVSSLGYFFVYLVLLLKPSHPSSPLSLYLGAHNNQEYFKRKSGGENESSLSRSRRRPGRRSG